MLQLACLVYVIVILLYHYVLFMSEIKFRVNCNREYFIKVTEIKTIYRYGIIIVQLTNIISNNSKRRIQYTKAILWNITEFELLDLLIDLYIYYSIGRIVTLII